MNDFHQYIVIKSSNGNLSLRIQTNDNAVHIKAKTDTQDLNKSFMLDDPELDSKITSLWSAIRTEINNQLDTYLDGIAAAWNQFQQNQ